MTPIEYGVMLLLLPPITGQLTRYWETVHPPVGKVASPAVLQRAVRND